MEYEKWCSCGQERSAAVWSMRNGASVVRSEENCNMEYEEWCSCDEERVALWSMKSGALVVRRGESCSKEYEAAVWKKRSRTPVRGEERVAVA